MGNDDRGHVALPKLYGAPAYSRPRVVPVQPVERPFDPDELPLASELSPEAIAQLEELVGRPYDGAASSGDVPAPRDGTPTLRGRPFRLRSIGSIIRGRGHNNGAG